MKPVIYVYIYILCICKTLQLLAYIKQQVDVINFDLTTGVIS